MYNSDSPSFGALELKDAATNIGTFGASVLVGAGIAKFVVNGIGDLSMPANPADTTKKLKRGDKYMKDGKEFTAEPMVPDAISSLVPVAVGVGLAFKFGEQENKLAAAAVNGSAAGMVAYGLGRFISAILPKATEADRTKAVQEGKQPEDADKIGDMVGKFLPLAGIGELYQPSIGPDVYDIPDYSRGYGIRAFMGAPFSATQVNGMNGAVVSSTVVNGMHGIGNAPMTSSIVPSPGFQPPLSASLM